MKSFLEKFNLTLEDLLPRSQMRKVVGGYSGGGSDELHCRCHSYNQGTGVWEYDNSGCWYYSGSGGGYQNWPPEQNYSNDITKNCASGVGSCAATDTWCAQA